MAQDVLDNINILNQYKFSCQRDIPISQINASTDNIYYTFHDEQYKIDYNIFLTH